MNSNISFIRERKIDENCNPDLYNFTFCRQRRYLNFDDLLIHFNFVKFDSNEFNSTLSLRSEFKYYPCFLKVGSFKFYLSSIDEEFTAHYVTPIKQLNFDYGL